MSTRDEQLRHFEGAQSQLRLGSSAGNLNAALSSCRAGGYVDRDSRAAGDLDRQTRGVAEQSRVVEVGGRGGLKHQRRASGDLKGRGGKLECRSVVDRAGDL